MLSELLPTVWCLFACSGINRSAFESNGWDVHTFDLRADKHAQHHVCDLDITDPADLAPLPDLIISFPPCTDLASAGARWWQGKREADPDFQQRAAHRARLAQRCGQRFDAPWAIENPVGALSTLWRSPDARFNPCDYGGYLPLDDEHPIAPGVYPPQDAYNKKTCLWYGGGFRMPPRRPVAPREHDFPGWSQLGGSSERTKSLRSLSPRGLLCAIAGFNRPEDS